MEKEVGVEGGDTIASSKGLYTYEYCWGLAKIRTRRKK
jgi:hypothetical protein